VKKQRSEIRVSALAALSMAVLSASCGLIDVDSFNTIPFDIPPQSFVVDSDSPDFKKPPVGAVPAVPCAGTDTSTCCAVPGVDCGKYPLVCRENKCAFLYTFEQTQTIDLAMTVPSLKQAGNSSLSAVNLKSLQYDVRNNLTTTLPPVEIWVAPANVKTKNNAAARKVTTLPAQAAMSNGMQTVVVDAAGQAAFSSFARNHKTPFNLITVIDMSLSGGQIVPQGKANITITGRVEAKF